MLRQQYCCLIGRLQTSYKSKKLSFYWIYFVYSFSAEDCNFELLFAKIWRKGVTTLLTCFKLNLSNQVRKGNYLIKVYDRSVWLIKQFFWSQMQLLFIILTKLFLRLRLLFIFSPAFYWNFFFIIIHYNLNTTGWWPSNDNHER